MLASVVTKASMVAMFGAIMPDPFAMPPSVTVTPSMLELHGGFFGERVGGADRFAAGVPSAPSASAESLMPAATLSMGRYWPITPVEETRTSSSSDAERRGVSRTISQASSIPRSPVQALALPLFTASAMNRPPARAQFLVHDDRRRLHDVGREHGRSDRRGGCIDQREILLRFLDAAMNAGGLETARRGNAHWGFQ